MTISQYPLQHTHGAYTLLALLHTDCFKKSFTSLKSIGQGVEFVLTIYVLRELRLSNCRGRGCKLLLQHGLSYAIVQSPAYAVFLPCESPDLTLVYSVVLECSATRKSRSRTITDFFLIPAYSTFIICCLEAIERLNKARFLLLGPPIQTKCG
jgi:hypothetical protein